MHTSDAEGQYGVVRISKHSERRPDLAQAEQFLHMNPSHDETDLRMIGLCWVVDEGEDQKFPGLVGID